MSTIRSLITGMLPIGSISITPSVAPRLAASRWVWQASAGSPLTRTPHEPQIACRHEQRMPIEPSKRSRACRIALEHRAVRLELDRVLVPVGRVAGLGVVAAQPEGELLRRAVVRFGHQYFLSSGSHWVIVTGE